MRHSPERISASVALPAALKNDCLPSLWKRNGHKQVGARHMLGEDFGGRWGGEGRNGSKAKDGQVVKFHGTLAVRAFLLLFWLKSKENNHHDESAFHLSN